MFSSLLCLQVACGKTRASRLGEFSSKTEVEESETEEPEEYNNFYIRKKKNHSYT